VGLSQFWRRGYYGRGVIVYAINESASRRHLELKDAEIQNVPLALGDRKPQESQEDHHATEDRDLDPGESHGTAVASVVCGKNIGIAPQCKYINLVVFRNGRSSDVDVVVALFRILENLKDPKEKGVLLMPLGVRGSGQAIQNAIETVYESCNLLMIAAAGNDPVHGLFFPAAYPQVVSVGGVNKAGEVEEFSDFARHGMVGPEVYGNSTALLADHVGLFSYSPSRGTSFAAAYVAGVAALLWGAHPELSRDEIRNHLKNTGVYPKDRKTGAKIVIATETGLISRATPSS
jgi:subtilisin family serine protease